MEPYELPAGSSELQLVRATAALVLDAARNLNEGDDGWFRPSAMIRSLGDTYGLCDDQPYVDQPAWNSCSAVLVAPDLVITAGHCLQYRVADLRVVFDYAYYDPPSDPAAIRVPPEQVYECTEVVASEQTDCTNDWAILRLDRPVMDRNPVDYRRMGAPDIDTPLLAVGTPSGIPLKVSTGRIRGGDDLRLFTDLDIFGGNSGSPVFNALTGKVEGIHVCSEPGNYVADEDRDCRVSLQCGEDGQACDHWAEATRITRIASILDALLGRTPLDPDGGTVLDDGMTDAGVGPGTTGGGMTDAGVGPGTTDGSFDDALDSGAPDGVHLSE